MSDWTHCPDCGELAHPTDPCFLRTVLAERTEQAEQAQAESRRLTERVEAAKIVATCWRDAGMEMHATDSMGALISHPCACILGALDGETDPGEVGVKPESAAGKALRALAAHQDQEGEE